MRQEHFAVRLFAVLTLTLLSASTGKASQTCDEVGSRVRVYTSYRAQLFNDNWHILIVPRGLDKQCLINVFRFVSGGEELGPAVRWRH